MKKLFLIFIFFLPAFYPALASIHADTTIRSKNMLDKDHWREQTKDLDYPGTKELKKPTNGRELKKKSFALPWVKYVVYGLIAGILVYVLIRLFRIKLNKKIKESAISIFVDDETNELIPDAPYESLMSDAIAAGNFRQVVRFSYLIALRELAARNLIVPAKDKTNYEYLRELFQNPVSEIFRDITYTFERTWYGEINITQPEFIAFEEKYRVFHEKIKSNA